MCICVNVYMCVICVNKCVYMYVYKLEILYFTLLSNLFPFLLRIHQQQVKRALQPETESLK